MAAGGDARDWSELPHDALSFVFNKLDIFDILMGAGLVCHPWLGAAEEPSLWKHLDMSSHNNVVREKCRSRETGVLCAMAKKAVDRSGGQLEVFVGEQFVDDDLLKYIGDRAPSLKVLRLTSCLHVLNEGFVEAIRKLPLLEELNLSTCKSIGGRATFNAVGKACVNLKQFILVKDFTVYGKFGDDEAYGIAAMHGLRSLKITCGEFNNKAMATILDRCPYLESLDLIQCYNVVMDGAMRAKCAGIKMLVDHSYTDIFPDGRLIL
ncbi:unnamed protein product [Urochloa decumbens]|uniref:F-box domain-containing protein n=1 Tax=Urochloa decumbens TaxID=240449 RepID=A0ABC9B9D1_9POAL